MTKEQIVNQLEKNVSVLKQALNVNLATTIKEGKEQYGSVAHFKQIRENLRTQVYTLNTFLEWIENNDNDIEDTYDIWDGGLNDLDISMFNEE